MAKENRFDKFKYTPIDSGKDIESPLNRHQPTENGNNDLGVSFNINVNQNIENKVPTNFTLYPSQKKKLKELAELFKKSGSTIVGEVIDQLHDAYIDK